MSTSKGRRLIYRLHRRAQGGFSTLAIAFVLLAFTIPIVFIAESVLVAGRQATSNALGQENLRAIDGAMTEVMGEIRLDNLAINKGCSSTGNATFDRSATRPKQGPLLIEVRCEAQTFSAARRELNFKTYIRQTTSEPWVLRGQARVKYFDEVGGQPKPGIDMLVCDWHLGEYTGSLAACPP